MNEEYTWIRNTNNLVKIKQQKRVKRTTVLNCTVCFFLGIIENSCTLKTCKHYAICQKGKCICPKKEECPQYSKRVCASDGQVYTNDCHMKAESCKLGKTLLDVGMEKCCKYILPCMIFAFSYTRKNLTSCSKSTNKPSTTVFAH
jgi:hypothetical protein